MTVVESKVCLSWLVSQDVRFESIRHGFNHLIYMVRVAVVPSMGSALRAELPSLVGNLFPCWGAWYTWVGGRQWL